MLHCCTAFSVTPRCAPAAYLCRGIAKQLDSALALELCIPRIGPKSGIWGRAARTQRRCVTSARSRFAGVCLLNVARALISNCKGDVGQGTFAVQMAVGRQLALLELTSLVMLAFVVATCICVLWWGVRPDTGGDGPRVGRCRGSTDALQTRRG